MAGTFKEEFENLTKEVAENTDAIASAIVAFKTLADLIKANAGDAAAVRALADQLDKQSNELGAAVAENTPTP